MVTSFEISGHKYGEPMDYVCPDCGYRSTRHWPPPYAFCPECKGPPLRQDRFQYPGDE